MLLKRGIIALCSILSSGYASAQGLEEISTCRAIENEVARLNCYDAVAKKLDNQGGNEASSDLVPLEESQDVGSWQVESGVDALTDKETFLAAIEANKSASFRPPALLIRCNGGISELFISWGDYLGDNTRVTSRFGDKAPETSSWGGATDKTATFLPEGKHNSFLDSLIATDRFVAQIEPYQSGPVTAVFEVSGIKSVMQGKAAVCGLVIN